MNKDDVCALQEGLRASVLNFLATLPLNSIGLEEFHEMFLHWAGSGTVHSGPVKPEGQAQENPSGKSVHSCPMSQTLALP